MPRWDNEQLIFFQKYRICVSDFGTIVYYILIAIPIAFTIFGLIYMCRTNCEIRKTCCEIRETCCPCCIDLEKTDVNLDYGDYYYQDGERRQDVMEVTF